MSALSDGPHGVMSQKKHAYNQFWMRNSCADWSETSYSHPSRIAKFYYLGKFYWHIHNGVRTKAPEKTVNKPSVKKHSQKTGQDDIPF